MDSGSTTPCSKTIDAPGELTFTTPSNLGEFLKDLYFEHQINVEGGKYPYKYNLIDIDDNTLRVKFIQKFDYSAGTIYGEVDEEKTIKVKISVEDSAETKIEREFHLKFVEKLSPPRNEGLEFFIWVVSIAAVVSVLIIIIILIVVGVLIALKFMGKKEIEEKLMDDNNV